MPVQCDIITCPEWKALEPNGVVTWCAKSQRIIFHHTDGHHPEIAQPATESRAESIAYAHAIQRFHMNVNGWIDSGHNFLVCRNGLILQGRWFTVTAIETGKMVVSAHCPGQNKQIGIEHEHKQGEPMTAAQRNSSARLMAWIADQYRRSRPLPAFPHSKYFATDCPDNLRAEIPHIVALAQAILAEEGDVL
jgi:N-acetylmuramoyl-L-alanine amidase-like protein